MSYRALLHDRHAYRLAEATVEFNTLWSSKEWEPVDSRDRTRLCYEWAVEFQSGLPAEALDDWIERAEAYFNEAYARWFESENPRWLQRIETSP